MRGLSPGHPIVIYQYQKATIDLADCRHLNFSSRQRPQCLAGRASTVHSFRFPHDDLHGGGSGVLRSDIVMCRGVHYAAIIHGRPPVELSQPKQLFDDTACQDIHFRKVVRSDLGTHRVLKIIVSSKLYPITALAGAFFVRSWLQIVRFHAYSWKAGVEHGDPNLWNLLYNDDTKCGVLRDHDLSKVRRRSHIPAGTILFVSMDFLMFDYWCGYTRRVYRHELETLVWTLPFVFIRYQHGRPRHGTSIDKLMSRRYDESTMEKYSFAGWFRYLTSGSNWDPKRRCQADYSDHLELASELFDWLQFLSSSLRGLSLKEQRMGSAKLERGNNVKGLWPVLVHHLQNIATIDPPKLGYVARLIDELELDDGLYATRKRKFDEMDN